MQVHLEENEIVEAIRNYIRAVIPVSDCDELPVVLTAGRGENGHTAAITIEPVSVAVQGAVKPTASMATYTQITAGAVMRNDENDSAFKLPAENPLKPTTDDKEAKVVESKMADELTPAVAEELKKSSLFKALDVATVNDSSDVVYVAKEVEVEADTPAEKPKAKSIFDNLN